MERKVLEIVRSICGDATPDNPVDLHAPYLPERTKEYVLETIANGHLSAGVKTKKFEEMICEITGEKYCVAMCNGTVALYATLMCLGLTQGTIKIPSLTFVATANAVVQTGMRPHFVEHEDAHIPVDLNGFKSQAIGAVRDSAQAFGIPLKGTRIYSFNQNKIITTALGGAVVTDDGDLARRIFHKITTARIPHPYKIEHDAQGWNYRMSDINAAIGIAQLEEFSYIMKAKQALADKYKEAFSSVGISMMESGNNWLNTILVPPEKQQIIVETLIANHYKARYLPTPIHLLKPFQNFPRDNLEKSVSIWKQAISLPSSPHLGFSYV